MLLTDCGIDQLEGWRNRIAHRFSEIVLGRPGDVSESYQVAWDSGEPDVIVAVVPAIEWQPEPDLMRFRTQIQTGRSTSDLDGREQRARILALRGLSQARDGEFERAQTTFASAARLDPRLDLALLPAFWELPRRAHEVAIAALRDANRGRDAASLAATVKTRFRPRALRAINCAVDRSNTTSE